MLPEHRKPKAVPKLPQEQPVEASSSPKGHNNARPTQLPQLILRDRSRPVAVAVARGMHLYHHVVLRVSRDRRFWQ